MKKTSNSVIFPLSKCDIFDDREKKERSFEEKNVPARNDDEIFSQNVKGSEVQTL